MATVIAFTRGNALQEISFDSATLSHKFESDISPHPQENGSLVTDNVSRKPQEISGNCLFTDYPLSVAGSGVGGVGEQGRARRLLETLIAVKDEGLTCTVSTSIGLFDNMKIHSVNVDRTQPMKGAIKFQISLTETMVARSDRVPLAKHTERKPQPKTDKGKQGTGDGDGKKPNVSYAKQLKNGLSKLVPSFLKAPGS
jgi:hypothetical protein